METTDGEADSRVLEVDRSAPLNGITMVHEQLPSRQRGTALLAVERFSLAANNLGYVLANDVLRTLDAFPASTRHRARIPVWGIAEVIDADPSAATVGTRVAGFMPMATHVAVRAKPTETGMLSIDEQRLDMFPIYRRLTALDNGSRSDDANVETISLPVYPFAALLAADVAATGVRTVVATSASSRSTAALSRLLTREGIDVIGLTSAKHRPSAKSFAVYDRVLAYDEVDQIDASGDTAYVDVAGSSDVTRAVHHHLGPHLTASIGVGATHTRSVPSSPGPPMSMFNTGGREVDLVHERGWQTVQSLYDDARTELIAWASQWLQVKSVRGLAGADQVWRDIVVGRSDPLTAVVIRP